MEFFAGIGAGWMNLASLALGLLAWMLPVAAMIRTAARPRALHPALPLVCVSFAACAAALYLQLILSSRNRTPCSSASHRLWDGPYFERKNL